MTFQEFLEKPQNISFEEYEKQIQEQHKRDRKIRALYEKMFDCEDALRVLSDEKGSDNYIKWEKRLSDCKRKLEVLGEV